MKLLFVILVSIVSLASCSAPKLYQQGLDKIDKAISKDPKLKPIPDTLVVTNTVVEIDTFDNVITKTVTNTVTKTVNECNYDSLAILTNRQIKLANRAARDYYKHQERMYKQETKRKDDSLSYLKQLNRQLTKQLKDNNQNSEKLAKEDTKQKKGSWFTRLMGEIWWLLLIIGLIGGFILKSYIPSISSALKRNKDERHDCKEG